MRELAGEPLIGHTINFSRSLPGIDRCIVTTDCPEIAAYSKSLGADVPFLRPSSLASDCTPTAPVIRHALEKMVAGPRPDSILLLEPTSPIRSSQAVQEAMTLLDDSPHLDGVTSVSEPSFNPLWVGVKPNLEGGYLERYFTEGNGHTRRQDLPQFLRINGNFYLWRSSFVESLQRDWFAEGRHGWIQIPESHATSVDTLADFEHLQALISKGEVRLPRDVSVPAENNGRSYADSNK